MTAPVLLLGVLAGLDNLQVCSWLGLLPMRRARLHALAGAFAACEIAAALLGLTLGHFAVSLLLPVSATAGPALVFVCGAIVLARAMRQPDAAGGFDESRMILGLPLSLSLDNVIVGAGIGAAPYPAVLSAAAIGAISAAMSCAGLYCGACFRRLAPSRIELAAGACLCLLAVRMLISDGT